MNFVIRDTEHPAEDIKRNWSAPVGGFSAEYGDDYIGFDSEEDAMEAADEFFDGNHNLEFRYHPLYEGYVEVHYEGLGGWSLDAENIDDALEEAKRVFGNDYSLASYSEKGDGHFFGEDVECFHEVKPGRWVFQMKEG